MSPIFEDDFVTTLSDGDISDEEQADDAVPKQNPISGTKRKRADKSGPVSSVKKQKSHVAATGDSDRESDGLDQKDEDMLSDFEFDNSDRTAALGDFDGWALETGGTTGNDSGLADIDAMVARKLGRKAQVERPKLGGDMSGVDEDSDDGVALVESATGESRTTSDEDVFEDAVEQVDIESSNLEEDLEEGSEEDRFETDDEEEEEEEEENHNLVADPMPEPDEASGSESEVEEDAEEAAKGKAFFADEPTTNNTAGSASFVAMNLSRPIVKGLSAVGFSAPTPIQAKAIPVALEGKDVVGGAVTGSGKTAAFMIPILERLLYRQKRVAATRVAVLMPTRELALQCLTVAKKLAAYTDITFGRAIGGLNSREQEKELKLRPDIVIATPGRFIDFMRNSTALEVDKIEILVLDEADRMLEEGFADELNEILTTIPKSRQTMLFSATMTSRIDDLVRAGLQRPVRLMVDAQKASASGLVQEFVRLRPGREGKRLGYLMYICANVHTDRVIVFFRQKKEAHRVRVIFALCGIKAAELHGSMSQEQRITAIESFRSGRASFLLATDLASRGLDIKGIDTVINFEAPQTHEIYLHRVGRTARAGRKGVSCTLAAEPDRKVVKAAVKAGKTHGAAIRQRTVDPKDADEWQKRCDDLADDVEDILREEKEERALQQTERSIQRAENVVKYEDEIRARPRKTWFTTEQDKLAAKQRGAELLNGPTTAGDEGKKRKQGGKLSNKKKKRLEDRDDRREGREWKKGKEMRGVGGKAMKEILGSEKKKAKPSTKRGGKKGK